MNTIKSYWIIMALFALVLLSPFFVGKIDFTADQRYSLSEATKTLVQEMKTPIRIDIFLEGDVPKEFQRLRKEAETLLKMMADEGGDFLIDFIDPFAEELPVEAVVEEMLQYGMTPENIVNSKTQNFEQTLVFPWAIVSNGSRSVRVSLLKKNLGDTQEQQIFKSIRQLEYQFLDALLQLEEKNKKNIAVLTSHQTSKQDLSADFLQALKPYYNLAAFDLKAFASQPEKTLDNLKRFDLLIISNPNDVFVPEEKQIIDQFHTSGGKSLWMINAIKIDRDSLFNNTGKAVAFANDLQLDDLFFKWGIRLNSNLIKDLYAAPIVMAQGSGNKTQYLPFIWDYYPLVKTTEKTLIEQGVGNVWLRFASDIDTLNHPISKQILLESSPLTKIMGTPTLVGLKEATQKRVPEEYTGGTLSFAVLLEGPFESLYKNKIKPSSQLPYKESGNSAALIIADGNFAENQLDKGNPLELGYDKWTNNFYNNKTFLVNSVHYLMDRKTPLSVRAKPLDIGFFDAQKIPQLATKIKISIAVFPLLLLSLFALMVYLWRKRFNG